MDLQEKIEQDFLEALKKKESRLSILRMLKAAIKNAEIEKRTKVKDLKAILIDEEIVALLRRQIKQLEEAAQDFARGGRPDLVAANQAEIETLKAYLPAGLSETELMALIEETVKELGEVGPQAAGRVIGAVMKKAGGRAEGNKVREAVNKILSSN